MMAQQIGGHKKRNLGAAQMRIIQSISAPMMSHHKTTKSWGRTPPKASVPKVRAARTSRRMACVSQVSIASRFMVGPFYFPGGLSEEAVNERGQGRAFRKDQ